MKGAALCQGPSQGPAGFVSVQQSSAQLNPPVQLSLGCTFLFRVLCLEPAELWEQPQSCWEGAPHSLSSSRAELVAHGRTLMNI